MSVRVRRCYLGWTVRCMGKMRWIFWFVRLGIVDCQGHGKSEYAFGLEPTDFQLTKIGTHSIIVEADKTIHSSLGLGLLSHP